MRILTLYHGSQTPLERPRFGYDNRYNDFGPGFYCSESLDMAKEWSSGQYRGGYANEYFIDTDGLGILDLNGRSILCWLAILIKNRPVRTYTGLATEAESWLEENFGMDLSGYDIIRGYRADDSYYSFARAFLNNRITVEQLRDAMHLGSLGEQIVIKSRRAFGRLVYEGSIRAEHPEYYVRRTARDDAARIAYREATATFDRDGILMTDLIRGEVSPDDGRLQRAVPGRRDDKSRRDGGVRHVACEMDIDEFWDMFLRSDESAGLRASTPFMFCGRSGTETAMRVISEADPGKELPPPVASDRLFPEYWCGWAVGFYQWYSRRPFAEIASAVPMSEVLSMYPALHGEPEERFAEAMDRRMPDVPRFRQVRESRGMSIVQLAERSGVPVAVIEDMECGRSSVNDASGETIFALSKALLCPMERLMEFNRAPSLDP